MAPDGPTISTDPGLLDLHMIHAHGLCHPFGFTSLANLGCHLERCAPDMGPRPGA